MADLKETVSGIEEKIYKIIGAYREAIRETERLGAENETLKKQLEEQKSVRAELEKKLNLLKTVKAIENKEDTAEAKSQINRLLREIDKCIGILNV